MRKHSDTINRNYQWYAVFFFWKKENTGAVIKYE